MADIRKFAFLRHFRTDPTFYVLRYRGGELVQAGRGLAFWFMPMSASVVEIPVDDRELVLMFHARSADFQDVAVQGVVTFRVVSPETLADRVDFTLDLASGAYTKQPLEKLSLIVTQIAQQYATAYVTTTPVNEILVHGYQRIRHLVQAGLAEDGALKSAGIEIVSVRIGSIKPSAELEKALEMPMREQIQQQADQASFARRALAVDSERAIQENELKNQIELARREQTLIDERGQNELKRVQQDAEAKAVEAESDARRNRVAAEARADALRMVEQAKVEGEKARMDIYRELPQAVMLGLAARELATKLERIEHFNVSPEMLGPLLGNLLQAGAERLSQGDGHNP